MRQSLVVALVCVLAFVFSAIAAGSPAGKNRYDVVCNPDPGDVHISERESYVKLRELGVPAELIRAHGAVSERVAQALAAAAAERFGADWGIGVTGIAGPTGGSSDKPVGLVFIGLAGPGGVAAHRRIFPGSREVVRRRASLAAMNYLRLALAATSKAGPEREIEE